MNWPYINPGEKRHCITIEQQVTGADLSGAKTDFVPFATTKAKIEFLRGHDSIKSGQDTGQLYLKVSIDYMPGVTSAMRVKSKNGTYTIQAIENVLEMNRVLNLHCIGVGVNQ